MLIMGMPTGPNPLAAVMSWPVRKATVGRGREARRAWPCDTLSWPSEYGASLLLLLQIFVLPRTSERY